MIVVMEPGATKSQVDATIDRVRKYGCEPQAVAGEHQVVIAVKGDVSNIDPVSFRELPGVHEVMRISAPYPTIARHVGSAVRPTNVVSVRGMEIGSGRRVVFGGPCSIASRHHFMRIAKLLSQAGADGLRGGVFKPRTGPYAFQGLEEAGIKILQEVQAEFSIAVATEATGYCRYPANGRNKPLTPTEAMAIRNTRVPVLELVVEHADLPWIGARNGQSFDLIQAAALEAIIHGKPLMLKRGPWMTIEEFLFALEYVARLGCPVIACLRGVLPRDVFRNRPDIADVAIIKDVSTVPVFVDPSHMAGDHRHVKTLAAQALVAGADGLLIEVSDNRQEERTDGDQAIDPDTFAEIVAMAHQSSPVNA